MLLYSFIVSFLITFILTPLTRKLALITGVFDQPNSRRINNKPVPVLGGIAIFGGFTASILIFFGWTRVIAGIILGAGLVLILGIIDDKFELTPLIKLLGQIGAAVILIFSGIEIEFITNPFGGLFYLGFWSIPLTILWVVGITNTVNLIDGLDGLAAGVSAIAAFTLLFVGLQEGQVIAALLAVAIAGSSLGFLRYNFYPADIFMGDAGAMFLGFVLAATSVTGALKSAAAVTLIVPVLALGIPIFDTVFAIIRRLYNNRPLGQADHGHIHHRLLALGWSQTEAVLIVYAISFFLGIMALVVNGSSFEEAVVIVGFMIITLLAGAWKIGIFTVDLPADGTSLEKSNI